jgi:tetratricopeptide (TPR) repeat protein
MVCRGGQPIALSADLDGLDSFANDYLALALSTAQPWTSAAYAWLGLVAMWRGRPDDAVRFLNEAVMREVAPVFGGSNRGYLLLARASAGDAEGVATEFGNLRSELPRNDAESTIGSWTLLLTAVEALGLVGLLDEAAELYEPVVDGIQRGLAFRVYDLRLLETLAGIAAAAGRRWSEAEQHFETALRVSRELPHRIEQADVRRFYGQALLQRRAAGDVDRAQGLLKEAAALYGQLGMPGHAGMVASRADP